VALVDDEHYNEYRKFSSQRKLFFLKLKKK